MTNSRENRSSTESNTEVEEEQTSLVPTVAYNNALENATSTIGKKFYSSSFPFFILKYVKPMNKGCSNKNTRFSFCQYFFYLQMKENLAFLLEHPVYKWILFVLITFKRKH